MKKQKEYTLALLVRDKNPASNNYGREGYATGVKNSNGVAMIEITTKRGEVFYSYPDDAECISPSHILRAVRQEKRARLADQFGEKFVSKTVARLFVIFGGNIETYRRIGIEPFRERVYAKDHS